MQEVTNKFITDPSLLWGMCIAIIVMAGCMIWLIKWILGTLIPVIERNSVAMNRVCENSEALKVSIKDLHSTMNDFLLKIASK